MRTTRAFFRGTLLVTVFGTWWGGASGAEVTAGTKLWAPMPWPALAYDVSAYELEPRWRAGGDRCWTLEEALSVLAGRVAAEKERRELRVYYYRIGHTLAFPLPLSQRPDERLLPQGISGISYPWSTWLSWELEHRWRILHAGWRCLGDAEAGALLQRELAALSGWEHFGAAGGAVSLVTGHLAGCLALALADASGWKPDLHEQAIRAANALLDRDVRPWFQKTWGDGKALTPARLHNIPTIALLRSAQLARAIGSPLRETIEPRAREAWQAWCKFRTGDERHSEGTAYDGFLVDSMTDFLAGLPDRNALLDQGREAFHRLADEWVQLSLPGRTDLHAPFGDVEPEMPFWANALLRLASWYGLNEAGWLLRRYPLDRLPAAALAAIPEHAAFLQRDFPLPRIEPREQLASATLRTGWNRADLLVAAGLPRCAMGHLHPDGGQVILGWQGRFWITDPGYQQYRPGLEREYTTGMLAHNAPVIGTRAQTRRDARLLGSKTDSAGRQHLALDLTRGYEGLPKDASVRRDIWLIPGEKPAAVVRDALAGLTASVEVRTPWLGGAHLAWAFTRDWARLSDGERSLWIGTEPGALEARALTRHEGSRGPLTLEHVATLPEGKGARWWVFQCDSATGWEPPRLTVEGEVLKVRLPGAATDTWTVP